MALLKLRRVAGRNAAYRVGDHAMRVRLSCLTSRTMGGLGCDPDRERNSRSRASTSPSTGSSARGLTDAARERVKQLIRLDHEFSRLSDACTWPDHPHGAWDTCIVERSLGTDVAAVAGQLRGTIIDRQRSEWLASGPTEWANESFAVATSAAVGYCVRTDAGCWYDAGRERLEPGSPERIVRDRLARAGVRLARLLNRALDPHGQ